MIRPIDYIGNILTKNFEFQHNRKLSEDLDAKCLDIPSIKDALILGTYSGASFIYDRENKLSILPPAFALKEQFFARRPLPSYENDIFHNCSPIGRFSPTIEEWRNEYPNFFHGDKKLLLIENYLVNDSYSHPGVERRKKWEARKKFNKKFNNLLEKLEKIGDFSDFLFYIQRPLPNNPTIRKDFYVGEGFFEYLSGMVLKKQGYLVSKPLGGSMDFVAFKSPLLYEELKETGTEDGAFLIELLLNKILEKPQVSKFSSPEKREAILVEAESSPGRTRSSSENSGFGQALKYLRERKRFNGAYSTGPLCNQEHDEVGTISFDKYGELIFKSAPWKDEYNVDCSISLALDYVNVLSG